MEISNLSLKCFQGRDLMDENHMSAKIFPSDAYSAKSFNIQKHWVAIFILSIILIPRGHCQSREVPAAQEEDIVELSRLEIIAQRYDWKYARASNVELLSNIDNKEAIVDLVTRLSQALGFIQAALPSVTYHDEIPIKIILYYDADSKKSGQAQSSPKSILGFFPVLCG